MSEFIFGGIGVTDDFILGFFPKPILAVSKLLGDSAFPAERYTEFHGL